MRLIRLTAMAAVFTGALVAAELPLVDPTAGKALPAPLPQVELAYIGVTWNDGQDREVSVGCVPAQAAGLPAGSLAWSSARPFGAGAIFLKPDATSPTGWTLFGFLAVTDGPKWLVPPQPWTPWNNVQYSAVLDGNPMVTATASVYPSN
jgi:hypothetical protein